MFVWSFRMSKRELIILIVGVVAFVVSVCLLLFSPSGDAKSTTAEGGFTLSADGAQEREAFLSQFGWEIEPDPLSVKEVVIPVRFNEVYAEYNELQKAQGFDLEKLCGKRVKIWTYRIKNYPNAGGDVVANLMIMDGKVVGGDISETALDGFMHGFDPNGSAAETAIAQLADNGVDRTVPDSIPAQSEIPPEADGD